MCLASISECGELVGKSSVADEVLFSHVHGSALLVVTAYVCVIMPLMGVLRSACLGQLSFFFGAPFPSTPASCLTPPCHRFAKKLSTDQTIQPLGLLFLGARRVDASSMCLQRLLAEHADKGTAMPLHESRRYFRRVGKSEAMVLRSSIEQMATGLVHVHVCLCALRHLCKSVAA